MLYHISSHRKHMSLQTSHEISKQLFMGLSWMHISLVIAVPRKAQFPYIHLQLPVISWCGVGWGGVGIIPNLSLAPLLDFTLHGMLRYLNLCCACVLWIGWVGVGVIPNRTGASGYQVFDWSWVTSSWPTPMVKPRAWACCRSRNLLLNSTLQSCAASCRRSKLKIGQQQNLG